MKRVHEPYDTPGPTRGDASNGSVIPVVLSGGSGTRLWPLSRAMYPKQFIKQLCANDTSLLGATLKRLAGMSGFAPPIILSNNDYRFLVAQEVAEAGLPEATMVLEPVAHNTAPAIAVAAEIANHAHPNAIMVVMPSDHVVRDAAAFRAAVERAAKVARTGRHVLFGIRPSRPHTGYGYICRGEALADVPGLFKVDAFAEKPNLDTARRYLESDACLWNSGIFVLHAATLLRELGELMPELVEAARAAVAHAQPDLGFIRLDRAAFEQAPSISIDHALMERTGQATVIALDVGWSDVGSWSSLWEVSAHDTHGNSGNGNAVLEDSSGCLVHSERALVAIIGLKDLIIVDTPDAVLVADKARAEDVGKIVGRLKSEGRKEHEQHLRNYRPWGFFETLSIGGRFQVKHLQVKPGGKLSLQMHHHRSEHWIVVQGPAKVTIGDLEQLVQENESVYIFATQWHRLENPGKVPLELIEVQIGTYLGEDDIVRSDDVYNRAPEETK